jgi:hypothetical protein
MFIPVGQQRSNEIEMLGNTGGYLVLEYRAGEDMSEQRIPVI